MGEDLYNVRERMHMKVARRWKICVDMSDIPRNVLYMYLYKVGYAMFLLRRMSLTADSQRDALASHLCIARSLPFVFPVEI